MPDTLMTEPCPRCGDALAHTTLLWPDPEHRIEGAIQGEILVERPGLWCAACGSAAPDTVDTVAIPTRRAA